MIKTTASLLATFTAAAAALTGCTGVDDPDPIISGWESAMPVGGFYNNLEIEDDLEGEATIYYYTSDGFYYADFDVEAEVDENGRYILDLQCKGDCAALDFEMECEMSSLGDEMECDGDGVWVDYVFDWRVD